MFFQDLIKNIGVNDRVLEIGPGATPHPRSDVFLERNYDNKEEKFAQTGYRGELDTSKQVFFYDENSIFPFKDNEFDYVICSHVLEHVADVELFVSEMCRVAKRGYMEFPSVYYEFLYNFDEHQNICFYDGNNVSYFVKDESFMSLKKIQKLFWDSLYNGYYYLADDFKKIFFIGFEWSDTISVKKVTSISDVVPDHKTLQDLVLEIVAKKNTPPPVTSTPPVIKISKFQFLRRVASKLKRLAF